MEQYSEPCTREARRWGVLRWIVRKNRPFYIIEDEELRDIFRMMKPRAEVPSANTVSKDIKEVYEMMKVRVVDYFEVCL